MPLPIALGTPVRERHGDRVNMLGAGLDGFQRVDLPPDLAISLRLGQRFTEVANHEPADRFAERRLFHDHTPRTVDRQGQRGFVGQPRWVRLHFDRDLDQAAIDFGSSHAGRRLGRPAFGRRLGWRRRLGGADRVDEQQQYHSQPEATVR